MSKSINVPKLRFKEFSGEWKNTNIGSIGTFFSGGTPASSNKSYYEGSIPFIGSGKIGANEVEQFITEEALKNSSAKIVDIGDLLYALYGATSGEVAISKINGAINQAVLCIRTDENKIFLKTWFEKNKENRFEKNCCFKTFFGNKSSKKMIFPKSFGIYFLYLKFFIHHSTIFVFKRVY